MILQNRIFDNYKRFVPKIIPVVVASDQQDTTTANFSYRHRIRRQNRMTYRVITTEGPYLPSLTTNMSASPELLLPSKLPVEYPAT